MGRDDYVTASAVRSFGGDGGGAAVKKGRKDGVYSRLLPKIREIAPPSLPLSYQSFYSVILFTIYFL